MNASQLQQVIARMENYLECWKHFHSLLTTARKRKCGPEDESQFLEVKSILAQELELILASIDSAMVTREEVHSLITASPTIRCVSEMNEPAYRNIEALWHKLFISWQSVLGQLKVKQQQFSSRSAFGSFFSGKRP